MKEAAQRRSRSVEIAVEGVPRPRWQRAFAAFCAAAMEAAGYESWDLAILLCGDTRMSDLNHRYRQKKGPTDVLSFLREESSPRPGPIAGDLALSLDTLRRNAAEFGCTEEEELKRLTVHGILHLGGMDHGPGRGGPMMKLQEKLLGQLQNVRITRGRTL